MRILQNLIFCALIGMAVSTSCYFYGRYHDCTHGCCSDSCCDAPEKETSTTGSNLFVILPSAAGGVSGFGIFLCIIYFCCCR